jgi:hypothetical protein
MLVSLFIATLLVALFPECASAWGPVTHLSHGAQILDDLHNLPAGIQQLLADQRWQYLYGCVAADIIQAKRYTRSIYTHCHSWRVGWKVLHSAGSPEEKAFAYGYLSHLAADVYSHNYFVPIQLLTSFPSRMRRHIYWEARFDSHESRAHRQLLKAVLQHRSDRCDALVERVVDRTLFSFRTNKRIFRSFVAIQRLHPWQVAVHRWTSRSRFSLVKSEFERYHRLCVASIRDLLERGEEAMVMQHDPNGHESLSQAKEIRRKLRILRRRRVPIEGLRSRILAAITEARDAGEPPAFSGVVR